MVICLDGELCGAGASIFTSVPFALSTKRTSWKMNEIDFGYIPDSGASFHLSRLKGELGTYLALTGESINWRNLAYFGFTKGTLKQDLSLELPKYFDDCARKEATPVDD